MNLNDTLCTVVTEDDVMKKWKIKDKRTARKYMQSIPHLKAYTTMSGSVVCERQLFDEVMEALLECKDLRRLKSMSMMTCSDLSNNSKRSYPSENNWAVRQLLNAGIKMTKIMAIIDENS